MQFKSKLNGDVVHAYNVADIKSYESSQGWEVVKDTAKQEKAENGLKICVKNWIIAKRPIFWN